MGVHGECNYGRVGRDTDEFDGRQGTRIGTRENNFTGTGTEARLQSLGPGSGKTGK